MPKERNKAACNYGFTVDPDPNMPRQPNEQREQSDVNIGYAESRERKSEAQFDQEDGLFKFEKRMR